MHSANQIILFHFALTIYDEFDDNAMVATYAVSLSMLLQIRLATIEIDDSVHNPDAIGPLLPIRSDTQRRNDGFDVVSATPTKANGKCFYEIRCSKISFCSTVARIRSFHVNSGPVGYT